MSSGSHTVGAHDCTAAEARSAEVRIPASTSNLGAGFDCFGLALQLYLIVRATADLNSQLDCGVSLSDGKENAGLPRTSENLIYRSMVYTAEREELALPPVQMEIDNEIPMRRGLGGSGAAIVAGIKLFELLCNRTLPDDKALQYATDFEGHADNVAPSLLGGFIVSGISHEGKVIAVRRRWPRDIKIVVVIPELHLDTKLARASLPTVVDHADAVFNLQRAALFNAALAEDAYDLLWEAMQDRLHQQKRSILVPGLAEALATPRMPGLLGLALSGSGPSVVALAQDHFEEIGAAIARNFERQGISTQVRQLEIDTAGCQGRVL